MVNIQLIGLHCSIYGLKGQKKNTPPFAKVAEECSEKIVNKSIWSKHYADYK